MRAIGLARIVKIKIFPKPMMPAGELEFSKFYWNLLELVGAFGKVLTIAGFFPIV
jgi:hypothetical protein